MHSQNFLIEPAKFGIVIQQAIDAGVNIDTMSPILFEAKDNPYIYTDPEKIFRIKITNFFYDNHIERYIDLGKITIILNRFNNIDYPENSMVFLPQTNQITNEKVNTSAHYCIVLLEEK